MTRRLVLIVALVILLVLGMVNLAGWLPRRHATTPHPVPTQNGSEPVLSVRQTLRLCSLGRSGTQGRVTVPGYVARVHDAETKVPLVGLFSSQGTALSQAGATTPGYPPSDSAVWVRSGPEPGRVHVPNGAVLTLMGRLDCITQGPGVGDIGGTFTWLRLTR